MYTKGAFMKDNRWADGENGWEATSETEPLSTGNATGLFRTAREPD